MPNRKTVPFREKSPTYQIGITGEISKKVFRKLLTTNNISLTPEQVGILNLLLEENGVSMQILSTKNNRDNSATTRLVDNLEKKGFVERRSSHSDRRKWEIHITEKGKKEIIKANQLGRKYVQKAIKGIPKRDLNTFFQVIKSIKSNIIKIESNN